MAKNAYAKRLDAARAAREYAIRRITRQNQIDIIKLTTLMMLMDKDGMMRFPVLRNCLETILRMNKEKLEARYPDGFSSDRSLHRAKDDI